jgi:uncharacterized membrane protein YhaH (DUF805 family)
MIDFMFSFRGRIGRLRYFLSCLALTALLVVAAIVVGGMAATGVAKANLGLLLPAGLLAIVVLPAFCYSSFSMQARRIRDIGWNPLYVIPAWIGVDVIDRLVAQAVPALSMGPKIHETLAGLLLNVAFGLVLLFWPGSGDSDSAPSLARIVRRLACPPALQCRCNWHARLRPLKVLPEPAPPSVCAGPDRSDRVRCGGSPALSFSFSLCAAPRSRRETLCRFH